MTLTKLLTDFEIDGRLSGPAFDRTHLRRALADLSHQRAIAFWVAIVVQAAVFALVSYFLIIHSNDAKVLAYVLPAGGGGLAACGWTAVRFWKEKVVTDLTIALVGSMDEDAAKTALGIVLDMFRKGQNATATASRQRAATKQAKRSAG